MLTNWIGAKYIELVQRYVYQIIKLEYNKIYILYSIDKKCSQKEKHVTFSKSLLNTRTVWDKVPFLKKKQFHIQVDIFSCVFVFANLLKKQLNVFAQMQFRDKFHRSDKD